jgi:phosphate:Na+ symporter
MEQYHRDLYRVMILIKLVAGLALITFGARFLRKGLDRLFGGRMIIWLDKTTRSDVQAMGAGALTGAVAPSSTGLSLLTAQILGDGKISTARMLAVLLGANVGMTLLANIAAVQVGDFAGLLLFLGVVGFQFVKRERIRGIGQCLLSLGFIFLAMNFLREGGDALNNSRDFGTIFAVLNHHPYILCLGAATLAVLLQSSTATVGLGIGLAAGGVLPGSEFLVWIIGTNLGLGITLLLVSWSSLEGRRLGVANLLAKLLVSALLIALNPSKIFLYLASPFPVPQQLALMHTAFNVLVALLCLPLLHGLLVVTRKLLVPDPATPADANGGRKSFLDPQALETPSIALAHATREALHMTDEVRDMLRTLWAAHTRKNAGQIKSVRSQDDTVDQINRQLMLYLSQIGELSDFDRQWHFMLLSYSSELEAIGDIIEKNLSSTVRKGVTEGFAPDPTDEAALDGLYQRTLRQFDLVASLVTTRETATAHELIKARDEINTWCVAQRRSHYERLKPGDERAFSASLCFLDLLDGLRRISNHLSTIAYEFKPAGTRARKAKSRPESRALSDARREPLSGTSTSS